MKHSILLLIVCWGIIGCLNTKHDISMPNGLYLITRVDTTPAELSRLAPNEKVVLFSELFDEYNSESNLRLIVNTSEYVPLDLKNEPRTVPETELKKKLLLDLTTMASEQLRIFTEKNVMRNVALVVDGEALTMHKIREAITGGQLQISRCNDNACERILVKLKDNKN